MIKLTKGEKAVIGAKKFTVGLGWDANQSNTSSNLDLDVSVFMLNSNKVIPTEENFIYYNQLKSNCLSVIHSGDCRNGETSSTGDDETISIDLTKIPDNIVEMIFVVTIYEAEQRKQNFGMVRNSYIRIYDEFNTDLVKYELDEDFSIETGIMFGRLYLKNGEWKFDASGIGYKEDLGYFVSQYYTGVVSE